MALIYSSPCVSYLCSKRRYSLLFVISKTRNTFLFTLYVAAERKSAKTAKFVSMNKLLFAMKCDGFCVFLTLLRRRPFVLFYFWR